MTKYLNIKTQEFNCLLFLKLMTFAVMCQSLNDQPALTFEQS